MNTPVKTEVKSPQPKDVQEWVVDRLRNGVSGREFGHCKPVGDSEVVVFHPSGKKFSIKVKEIQE